MMAPMPQGMPSPADIAAMGTPDMAGMAGLGGMGGMGAAMAGMPSLSLDMGPSMPIATIGNTTTGGQETSTGNGAFLFKGSGLGAIASDPTSVRGIATLAAIAAVGYFVIRRFT